jgi:hypothetical protein
MNSLRRGAPVHVAPVLRMPVMTPTLADGLTERFVPLPVTERTRRFELGMVQQIECGRAQAQMEPLRDAKALLQGRIDLVCAGTVRDVTPQVTQVPLAGEPRTPPD